MKKLEKQLEQEKKEHKAEIEKLKTFHESEIFLKIKELEEDHTLIMDGIKMENEDIIKRIESDYVL